MKNDTKIDVPKQLAFAQASQTGSEQVWSYQYQFHPPREQAHLTLQSKLFSRGHELSCESEQRASSKDQPAI